MPNLTAKMREDKKLALALQFIGIPHYSYEDMLELIRIPSATTGGVFTLMQ